MCPKLIYLIVLVIQMFAAEWTKQEKHPRLNVFFNWQAFLPIIYNSSFFHARQCKTVAVKTLRRCFNLLLEFHNQYIKIYLPLPSGDQIKLLKFNSDFSNNFFFLILSFQKHIAKVHFSKTDWYYIFLKAQSEKQTFFLKNQIESAWNLDFKEVNFGRYAICNAIHICF